MQDLLIEEIPDDGILSVGELAFQISRVLEADPILSDVVVRGEISNFKAYASGHLYFTLKDANACIDCVMFRSDAQRLKFEPGDGMELLASGRRVRAAPTLPQQGSATQGRLHTRRWDADLDCGESRGVRSTVPPALASIPPTGAGREPLHEKPGIPGFS